MLKIGDFARLGGVSVEALRHYDEIGLLKPARIDTFTGYRYYEASQLARLNRILALKDLGFSLRQVEAVLEDTTIEQLTGMLALARAQAEQSLAREQERLTRLAARLRQVELEEDMATYDVVLKDAPAMLVASVRVTVPENNQVGEYLGRAFDDAYVCVKSGGGKDTGPCLAVWHQPAAVLQNEVVEAVVPVDRRVPETDRAMVYELPATRVASVVHEGDFAGMTNAHAVLLSWMHDNGFEPGGGYREVYIQHNPRRPDESVTEIQYPVAPGTQQ